MIQGNTSSQPATQKHLSAWPAMLKQRLTLATGARLILYAAVFGEYYWFSLDQLYGPFGQRTDLTQHIKFAAEFAAGQRPDSYPGLYLLWIAVARVFQLTLPQASLIVDPLLMVAVALIIRTVLRAAGLSEREQLLYTTVLMVVTPLYDPLFNTHLYLGQISANVYHNPTLLAVKPFAYLSLLLYVRWFEQRGSLKYLLLAALAIILSVAMKPNFVLAFVPALLLYLLIKAPRLAYWWQTAILGAIVLVALAAQYAITYQQAGASSQVMVDILGVWRLYSPNPAFSTLLSLAFPLAIVAFRWKQTLRNDYLVLSWLSFGVALAEFAVLAESGNRYSSGNFGWGVQVMMPLVFLFSIVEWVRWLRDGSPRRLRWDLAAAGLLLALHVLSGVVYLVQIYTTHIYTQ